MVEHQLALLDRLHASLSPRPSTSTLVPSMKSDAALDGHVGADVDQRAREDGRRRPPRASSIVTLTVPIGICPELPPVAAAAYGLPLVMPLLQPSAAIAGSNASHRVARGRARRASLRDHRADRSGRCRRCSSRRDSPARRCTDCRCWRARRERAGPGVRNQAAVADGDRKVERVRLDVARGRVPKLRMRRFTKVDGWTRRPCVPSIRPASSTGKRGDDGGAARRRRTRCCPTTASDNEAGPSSVGSAFSMSTSDVTAGGAVSTLMSTAKLVSTILLRRSRPRSRPTGCSSAAERRSRPTRRRYGRALRPGSPVLDKHYR